MQKRIASGCGIRRVFVALLAACAASAVGATPAVAEVFDGDVYLTTQTQVDNFADSGITEVTGNVAVLDYLKAHR